MKIVHVPILTEEYKVIVVIGTNEELAKYAFKNCKGRTYGQTLELVMLHRGTTWDRLPEHHPVITVNGDIPWNDALATLAHEACHAVGMIQQHLGLRDEIGGEFLAHGIGSVLRHCIDKLKITPPKKTK